MSLEPSAAEVEEAALGAVVDLSVEPELLVHALIVNGSKPKKIPFNDCGFAQVNNKSFVHFNRSFKVIYENVEVPCSSAHSELCLHNFPVYVVLFLLNLW